MDAIKTYFDNVFAAFPQTKEVENLKGEMLASMEEKYQVLKEAGMSEHEAVGNVIANFGNINEIMAELGLEQKNGEPEAPKGIPLSREEARAYLTQMKGSSLGIGLGVWLLMTGIASLFLLGDRVGIFTMFAAIAGAVGLFVLNGTKMGEYEIYQTKIIRLDPETSAEIEGQKAGFMPRFAIRIVIGVAVILLAVGGFVTDVFDGASLSVLLFAIGFAVLLFITAGVPLDSYDVLLNKGDYANKETFNEIGHKLGRIIGTVAAVYWPVMAAAYLLWSFIGNAWHNSWIIWPVAGVLFGAFSGGISVWFGMQRK